MHSDVISDLLKNMKLRLFIQIPRLRKQFLYLVRYPWCLWTSIHDVNKNLLISPLHKLDKKIIFIKFTFTTFNRYSEQVVIYRPNIHLLLNSAWRYFASVLNSHISWFLPLKHLFLRLKMKGLLAFFVFSIIYVGTTVLGNDVKPYKYTTKDHNKIVGCYWGTWAYYR